MDHTSTWPDESHRGLAPDTETEEQRLASKWPLISVIIPTYNQAPLLAQTLESVLNQPYRYLEIIVVNSGSTDETARTLQPYHDRIRYFYQEHDGRRGFGRAINLGIQAARGEYIHTLAAGDRVTETYYTRVMQEFHAQPHIGAVATDAYRLRDDQATTEIFQAGHFKTQQEFLLEALDHNPIIGSTMIVKGFCYEAVGLRRPEFETLDDYDHWLRLGAQFEIAYLARPLVECRTPAGESRPDIARIRALERQLVGEFRRHTAIQTFFPELRQAGNGEQFAQAYERIGRIFAGKGWHEEAGEEFERASLCRNAVTPSQSAHRSPRSAREPAAVPPSKPSLRILFVIHDFLPDNFAGAELHTFHQARALQAAGHAVAILQADRGSAQPEGSIRETVYEGLKIYKMAVQPAQLVSLFRNDTATQSFAAFLEQQPFDLIHFQHLLYLGGALLETAKKKGIPTVLTLHDAWFLCQEIHLMQNHATPCSGPETVDKCAQCFIQSRVTRPEGLTAEEKAGIYQLTAYRKEYLRPFLSQPDLILAPSRFMKQMFTRYGVAAERIVVFPLGVHSSPPAGRTAPRDRSALRFVFLGNIAPIKGVDTLIQAFKSLRHRAELHIHGKISDAAYANPILEEVKGLDNIVYHGAYRPEALSEILAGADALLLPSLNENSPIVIREAFAAGVPVIASNVGGIPELVQDGVNGLLFEARDVADLQEKLERICANPALLDALRAGITPVRTLAAEVEDLQAHYGRLMEGWAPSRRSAGPVAPGAPSATSTSHQSPTGRETQPAATPTTPSTAPPASERISAAAQAPAQGSDKRHVVLYALEPLEWACPTIRLISPLSASPMAERFRWSSAVTINAQEVPAQMLMNIHAVRDADVVTLQRGASSVDGVQDLLAYAKERGKPVVYDIDDYLIDLPADHPQKAYYDAQRHRTIQVMSQVDVVTVSTPKLREFLLPYNPNVTVLPNVIDLDIWSESPAPRRDARLALVYMGTLTHDGDVDMIAPALRHILQKYAGRVVLRFWGYVPPAMRHVARAESMGRLDNNYYNFARNFRRETFDLAVAPLVDTPFNRCKSHIKYLEYSACHIPGVYARLEPYTESVKEGVTGLLAGSDPDEWVAALERLIEDEALRHTLAENAYWDVVSQYSTHTRCEEWATLYEGLARRVSPPAVAVTAPSPAPAASSVVTIPSPSAAAAAPSVPPLATKKVSIIIPVFNKADYTRNCLESLFANTAYANYEVLVVDNGSTDETPQLLAAHKGRVKFIRNDTNLGFAKACNQGARAARGDYLVFLNNDTLPQASWLDALVASAEQEPQAAVIGAKLLYPNDTIQHAGVIFSVSSRLPYHIYRNFERTHPAVNRLREFPAVTGACMLVKRGVFFEAGLFDESYINCYEDVDLCMKIQELGYKVLYNPRSEVYHYESITEGRRDRAHLERSYSVLRHKWDFKIPTDETRYYTEDNLAIEYIDANNLKVFPLGEAEQRLNRARALRSQGNWQEALRTVEAITDEQHRFEVCMVRGDCFAQADQADEAVKHYEAATRLNQQSERPHIGFGVVAVRRGRFEEAIKHFEQALALNPQNDNALCGLGLALASLERPEQAMEKYQQALDANPRNITALSSLQACALEQRRFGVAEDYFRRYLAIRPGDLSVLFGLSGIYLLMGDAQQARLTLHRILKLDPNHKDATALLNRLDAPTAAVS